MAYTVTLKGHSPDGASEALNIRLYYAILNSVVQNQVSSKQGKAGKGNFIVGIVTKESYVLAVN